METANVSAIISAVAGISGVLLGNSFVAIKEWLTNRYKRQKDTAYLAVIVVSHLDRFASGCLHVALDDGTECGQPAGRNAEEHEPTIRPPEFQPLDLNVEWKVLPQQLMYSILLLPDQREQIQNRLMGMREFDDDYPYHTEYFWARRRDYAELGLRASDLARHIRKQAGLPFEEPDPDAWSRDGELTSVIKRIDEAREARDRRVAEYQAKVPDGIQI
jgi:hypothetical protein